MDELFNKKFRFVNENDEWKLPSHSVVFTEDLFEINKLKELKEQLNQTRSKLEHKNSGLWGNHTWVTNRAGLIVPVLRRDFEPELCTQVRM